MRPRPADDLQSRTYRGKQQEAGSTAEVPVRLSRHTQRREREGGHRGVRGRIGLRAAAPECRFLLRRSREVRWARDTDVGNSPVHTFPGPLNPSKGSVRTGTGNLKGWWSQRRAPVRSHVDPRGNSVTLYPGACRQLRAQGRGPLHASSRPPCTRLDQTGEGRTKRGHEWRRYVGALEVLRVRDATWGAPLAPRGGPAMLTCSRFRPGWLPMAGVCGTSLHRSDRQAFQRKRVFYRRTPLLGSPAKGSAASNPSKVETLHEATRGERSPLHSDGSGPGVLP
jgi:hypothetical protein